MEIAMTTNTPSIPPGRPVAPARLQTLGKTAAQLSDTSGISLTQAVVATVEREKLNSEQVRRVVEAANIEAFNQKYASMTGDHRFVNINDGPADPAQVLQSLDCEAQAMQGTTDYDHPPVKTASYTSAFTPIFRTSAGIAGDVARLQVKLASMHETAVQDAEASSFMMNEAFAELADWSKRAGLNGALRGEIHAAWSAEHPLLAKVACSRIFGSVPGLQKVAGRRIASTHDVVRSFQRFVKSASAYTQHLQARQDVEAEITRVSAWLTENRS